MDDYVDLGQTEANEGVRECLPEKGKIKSQGKGEEGLDAPELTKSTIGVSGLLRGNWSAWRCYSEREKVG
jgi:hypothetical protein